MHKFILISIFRHKKTIMVYFLAPDEIESVPSSSRLDSSLKLVKTFCGTANYHDYLIHDAKRLIFYEIGQHNSARISSVIYTNDGTIAGYESNNERLRGMIFTFRVLPVIGIAKIKNAGIKISFKGVPGHSCQPVVPDHIIKFGENVSLKSVSSAGSYFVISAHVYQSKLWSKLFQWLDDLEMISCKSWSIFVLLEIQQQNSSYNVVEICRIKTEEHVQGKYATVYSMVSDEKQERLFFCTSSKEVLPSPPSPDQEIRIYSKRYNDILVYNVKSGRVEDSINVSSHLRDVHVFSHPKYGECIFAITWRELIVFSRNDIGRYQIFHTESLCIPSGYEKSVFKNRNNQILVCYQVTNGIEIRDVFDSSNEVIIRYSSTIFPLRYSINFNDTGEEIYICENGTLKIYVYKSYLRTLLLLSAAVVSKTHSLSQLTEMKLPKHLHKYL